jgi:hypothetical protein
MLSEGNAHPVCLQIVMAVWYPFCLNSNFLGRGWQPSADNNGVPKAITIWRGLSHLTRSLSRIVCRGQECPKGIKGTLRPDFQINTRPRIFKKANVTTRYKKTVVRNPGIVSWRQFRDNEPWIQQGQESPLMNIKGLMRKRCQIFTGYICFDVLYLFYLARTIEKTLHRKLIKYRHIYLNVRNFLLVVGENDSCSIFFLFSQ